MPKLTASPPLSYAVGLGRESPPPDSAPESFCAALAVDILALVRGRGAGVGELVAAGSTAATFFFFAGGGCDEGGCDEA